MGQLHTRQTQNCCSPRQPGNFLATAAPSALSPTLKDPTVLCAGARLIPGLGFFRSCTPYTCAADPASLVGLASGEGLVAGVRMLLQCPC